MDKVKRIAKAIPGVTPTYRTLRGLHARVQEWRRLKTSSPEELFTDYYQQNTWGGSDSVSGVGSDLEQTRVVARELPKLLNELGVTSLLDIPCGDFHWMRTVDLDGIDYLGGDIVEKLVLANQAKYKRPGVRFSRIDLMLDVIPKSDVILCRDCLVHLCYADLFKALGNICRSESTYLLTTTFVDRDRNEDILTGQWRPLNLERPPLSFPAPNHILIEQCTESDGAYKDKALGLWRIEDLRDTVARGNI